MNLAFRLGKIESPIFKSDIRNFEVAMLNIDPNIKIYIATGHTDMRKGIDVNPFGWTKNKVFDR